MFESYCFFTCVEDSLIGPQFDKCLSHGFITCAEDSLTSPQFDECLKVIALLLVWKMVC